jgi:hypothetical protein
MIHIHVDIFYGSELSVRLGLNVKIVLVIHKWLARFNKIRCLQTLNSATTKLVGRVRDVVNCLSSIIQNSSYKT